MIFLLKGTHCQATPALVSSPTQICLLHRLQWAQQFCCAVVGRSIFQNPPLEVSRVPLELPERTFLFRKMQVNLLQHMNKILCLDPVVSDRDGEFLPLASMWSLGQY